MNKTLRAIRSWLAPLIRASGTSRPSKWLLDWWPSNKSDSGIVMDTEQALSYAPVVQALTVLSGDIGQIPLDLYRRRDEKNKEKDRDNPLFKLAGRRANRYMSAATFRETMMIHALLYGNGVAEIERNGRGQPVALWPLVPGRTSVEVVNGVLWYKTRVGAEPGARDIRLRPENVIHISNFGSDGLWGYSTLYMARNSWGLGVAAEKYANKYFAHGGQPSGVLKYPEKLDEPAYNRLKRSWKENHEGMDNAARISILEEGAEYQAIAFSQKDSQWLESRHFQREDVASWFNLPPHKLGVLHDANYSNMVEQNRGYLTTSLGRWEGKWEDEYNEKLLTEQEQNELFFEFNNDSLLKADIKTRYDAYSTALGGHPFMSPNEIRGKENMPEVEGGDDIPEPANMNPEKDGAEGGEKSDRTGTPNNAKIAELLTCEANRVCHAARTASNFVGWLDSFYGRWFDTWVEAVPECSDESKGATVVALISRHKEECLDVAGSSKSKEELYAQLTAATAGWPMRARNYADKLESTERIKS
jgi:HK97 family phage portal protein